MNIIPIEFTISAECLADAKAEDIEQIIKTNILSHIQESISPLLDDDNFIDMAPTEDGFGFDIKINLMIGSTFEYIDAISEVTSNLATNLIECGYDTSKVNDLANKATQPLIDLVK